MRVLLLATIVCLASGAAIQQPVVQNGLPPNNGQGGLGEAQGVNGVNGVVQGVQALAQANQAAPAGSRSRGRGRLEGAIAASVIWGAACIALAVLLAQS